jgi:uncharacterized membrane protein (DUF106 family)
MIWFFNSAFGKLFEFIFFPFQRMSPWVAMALISFLTSLLMLLFFRLFSNQKGIRKVKNKIKAHLLEFRLFKDSLSLSLRAQGNILRYNLKYIGYSAKPLLVMFIPIVLILIQLNLWFGYQALSPGQETIVKVKLVKGQNPLVVNLSLDSSKLDIETLPLRIEGEREIDWRIKARENGSHNLTLTVGGQKISKRVIVGQKPLVKISQAKVRRNFIAELFNPGEPPLAGNLPLKSVEVLYPSRNMNLFGWHLHWLIVYFALSIIFGFAFKGIFKVEI